MTEPPERQAPRDPSGESGQITILVVFGVFAFVLLVAFVYNTAKQTSRKIEMQGAADSSAVASGVWMARGMNLTALNNNTMVEVLSIMVTVRSLLQTDQLLRKALIALLAVPYVGAVARFELQIVNFRIRIWEAADRVLNRAGGIGWSVLTGLDTLNRWIKRGFPPIAAFQSANYARLNGADWRLPGLLLPGRTNGFIPVYPLARGPRTVLVTEARECALKSRSDLRKAAMVLTIAGPITLILGPPTVNSLIDRNLDNLAGRRVSRIPLITGWLSWQADVKPMILTERPESQETRNLRPNLARVHEYLQLLAVAFGQTNGASPIGGEHYPNPDVLPLITYAQADVYNPTSWDMFTQDWRAQLVRARLLDAKWRSLQGAVGLSAGGGRGWSFVNTH